MAFDSWQALLEMGGHGPYVWSAYVMTLMVMSWLIVAPLARGRRLRREIAAQARRRTATPTAATHHDPGVE